MSVRPDWLVLTRSERLAVLEAQRLAGASATEMASLFRNATRNSIIGTLKRVDLPLLGGSRPKVAAVKPIGGNGSAGKHRKPREITAPRPNGNKGQPKATAIVHRIAMAEAKPPRPMPVPEGLPDPSERLRLSDVTGRCKWCEGDPLTPDHSFCGQPVKEGTSWCPSHYARVYLSR